MSTLTVTTSLGSVRGVALAGVEAFLGIPYAAPPSGALRFETPQPPAPWLGVRDAIAHGPAPHQPRDGLSFQLGLLAEHPQSEDCLTLNVWRPAARARELRAVMLWLHGGAFVSGTAAGPAYQGAALARRGDVLIVSLNYRVGALGFLQLGAGRSNLGLLDQVAALRFVQREIAAFGGDPARVTVFGESAGGGSLVALLAMPAARGLFARAILQSAAPEGQLDAEEGAARAQPLGERLGGRRGRPRMAALVARGAAEAQSRVRADTWMYRFGWRSPHSAGALGAWHALDVPFALGTYADSPELREFSGSGEAAERVAHATMDAWSAFARTGDPSCASAGEWPRYDAERHARARRPLPQPACAQRSQAPAPGGSVLHGDPTMKLGAFFMPSHPPERPLYDALQWDLATLEQLDRLGFHEAWIGEHFTAPWEPVPAPDLLIAQALLRTSQIKLCPGAHLLPYHHPIELAHRIALLDHLAQGRYMLGVGISALPSDLALYGVDAAGGENRRMTLESLDIMLRLWRGEPFDFDGAFWKVRKPASSFDFLRLHLTPYQKPHPPIGIAGLSAGSETLKLAGERGFLPLSISLNDAHTASHWGSVEEGARRSGRNPSRADWRLVREVYVAPTDAEAKRRVRDGALGRCWRDYLLPFYVGSGMAQHFLHPGDSERLLDVDYLIERSWLVGSPDTVTRKLASLAATTGGFGTLLVMIYDYSGEQPWWDESLRLLTSEVMPNFSR